MENILTGGAETRLGRERRTSSLYTSWNSISASVFGDATNPSLTCTVPVACFDAREDTRLTENGCVAHLSGDDYCRKQIERT